MVRLQPKTVYLEDIGRLLSNDSKLSVKESFFNARKLYRMNDKDTIGRRGQRANDSKSSLFCAR